jgi:hypothetical protein
METFIFTSVATLSGSKATLFSPSISLSNPIVITVGFFRDLVWANVKEFYALEKGFFCTFQKIQ